MRGVVESIIMVRDSFYVVDGYHKSNTDSVPDTVRLLEDGATYNVGDANGEIPTIIASGLLNSSDAAPYTVDGKLWSAKVEL